VQLIEPTAGPRAKGGGYCPGLSMSLQYRFMHQFVEKIYELSDSYFNYVVLFPPLDDVIALYSHLLL
jgi:hypothetical protein